VERRVSNTLRLRRGVRLPHLDPKGASTTQIVIAITLRKGASEMTKRPRRSAIVVSALVVIAASVAVTAAMAASSGKALKPHAGSARLVHIFNVLQGGKVRGHSASVGAAQPLPAAAGVGLSQMPGLDPSAAVFAGGTYATWVVPGSTEICLISGPTRPGTSSGGGGVCGSIAGAEERGLAVTTESASGAPVVLGLVPNGNPSVTVTNTDGTTETIPVKNNVYEITSGHPSTVSLNEASGNATTRHLPVLSRPPASAPAGSATP
jgi:hypothetical protein